MRWGCRMKIAPTLDAVLAALHGKPRGLRATQVEAETSLSAKRAFRALAWLQEKGQIGHLRDGGHRYWLLAEFMESAAAEIQEESRARHRARQKDADRRRALLRKQGLDRSWPAESHWTPPGPRIPSVWHLAEVLA